MAFSTNNGLNNGNRLGPTREEYDNAQGTPIPKPMLACLHYSIRLGFPIEKVVVSIYIHVKAKETI